MNSKIKEYFTRVLGKEPHVPTTGRFKYKRCINCDRPLEDAEKGSGFCADCVKKYPKQELQYLREEADAYWSKICENMARRHQSEIIPQEGGDDVDANEENTSDIEAGPAEKRPDTPPRRRTRAYSDSNASSTEPVPTPFRSLFRELGSNENRFRKFKGVFERKLALAQLSLTDAQGAIDEKDIKEIYLYKDSLVNEITELEATLSDALRAAAEEGSVGIQDLKDWRAEQRVSLSELKIC